MDSDEGHLIALVEKNKTTIHQVITDFEVQTGHLILLRRPDLILISKRERTYHLVNLTIEHSTE